jgi:hypothetical protein
MQLEQTNVQARRSTDPTCICTIAGMDQKYLITGDGVHVAVWDRESGVLVNRTHGLSATIVGVAAHPLDPNVFASFSSDGSLVVHVFPCFMRRLAGALLQGLTRIQLSRFKH